MTRVLVTGAAGFVGKAVTARIADHGWEAVAAVRNPRSDIPGASKVIVVDDICERVDWESRLTHVDAIIHLAARAHVMVEPSSDPLAAFRAVNVDPAIALFEAAQRAGVGRFVFVSSIGVNGNATTGAPFRESDAPNPTEHYAISKWEAEQALLALALADKPAGNRTGLTILRPALIYGPGAKGNLLRLMQWVARGWPIPTASRGTARSFASLNDFCELLLRCLYDPAAVGETFLAADPEPVPLARLIRVLANAMNSRTRCIPLPSSLLRFAGRALGREAQMQRLFGSLEVDASKARRLLGWPATDMFEAEIGVMIRTFKQENSCASHS